MHSVHYVSRSLYRTIATVEEVKGLGPKPYINPKPWYFSEVQDLGFPKSLE